MTETYQVPDSTLTSAATRISHIRSLSSTFKQSNSFFRHTKTHRQFISLQQEAPAFKPLPKASLTHTHTHTPEGGLLPVVVTTASSPLLTLFPFSLTSHTRASGVCMPVCVCEREGEIKKTGTTITQLCVVNHRPRCQGGSAGDKRGPHVFMFFYQFPSSSPCFFFHKQMKM